jgi:ribose 5-phosphate isomerase B
MPARLVVGSDHGGVDLRSELVAHAERLGHEVIAIVGPATAAEAVDYPDVARDVAHRVAADPDSLGLLVCGTGQGMAIAANKVDGVRAGVVLDPFSARMLREHNDANVLCLGQRVVGVELAKILLETFLAASFTGGRHSGRVDKIVAMEGEARAAADAARAASPAERTS